MEMQEGRIDSSCWKQYYDTFLSHIPQAPLNGPYLQVMKVIFTDSYWPRPRDRAHVNECMVHECDG